MLESTNLQADTVRRTVCRRKVVDGGYLSAATVGSRGCRDHRLAQVLRSIKAIGAFFEQHIAHHGFYTPCSATGCSQINKAILSVLASALAYTPGGVPYSCVSKSISKVPQILQL